MLSTITNKNDPVTGQAGTDVNPLVRAMDLGIKYYTEKKINDDFKAYTHNFFDKLFKVKRTGKFDAFWALQNINFEGYPGDVIGIVGSNGAGKTTLCRAVLGLVQPNQGNIEVNGSTASLLTLGAGFNPQLSGRDNIFSNAVMLGLNQKKIKELAPSIQEFSGIDERFSSMPLKSYSNGMKARLGFSVAAAIEADILVIDEILSAGDFEFQKKAALRIIELVQTAKMAMVVTHNPSFVEKFCNKALWLEEGKIKAFGNPLEVANDYKAFSAKKNRPKNKKILSECKTSPVKKDILIIEETRAVAGKNKTIEVENLGICFKVNKKPFWALKGITFNTFENEIVGIIGSNGAGKTTLCRSICGLYNEDRGTVTVNGTVTALLSFGAGFNQQLTGIDNIYLNSMMLGIPKREITKLEKKIIEFAELENFISKPVKYYSGGMLARLGFSIAAMLNPDILVIDEALSAGDLAFQEKAAARMQQMIADSKSVIIVTHSLPVVEKLCTRAIWLDKGKIKHDGDPRQTVAFYKEAQKQVNSI